MPEPIGAVAIHAEGGLLVALASGLYRFDPGSGALLLVQPTVEGAKRVSKQRVDALWGSLGL